MMPVPDSLSNLADELRAMPPRARRAILRSLTDAERAFLADHVERAPDMQGIDGNGDSNRFSPAFARRIRQARGGDPLDPTNRMTASTRQALVLCADDIVGAEPTRRVKPVAGPGRSLFDAFGGFMSPRGVAR